MKICFALEKPEFLGTLKYSCVKYKMGKPAVLFTLAI
jgi:hypothetical protein